MFYLKDKANLWWAMMRERQYEPGFNWNKFKEMIKDHFYPISLQKAKEREFMHATVAGEHERTRVHLQIYGALMICPNLRS